MQKVKEDKNMCARLQIRQCFPPNENLGADKIAQWLRARTPLAKDQSSGPRTYQVAKNCLYLCLHSCAHTHTHTYKISTKQVKCECKDGLADQLRSITKQCWRWEDGLGMMLWQDVNNFGLLHMRETVKLLRQIKLEAVPSECDILEAQSPAQVLHMIWGVWWSDVVVNGIMRHWEPWKSYRLLATHVCGLYVFMSLGSTFKLVIRSWLRGISLNVCILRWHDRLETDPERILKIVLWLFYGSQLSARLSLTVLLHRVSLIVLSAP